MPNNIDLRENIASTLGSFATQPLADASKSLFRVLGYASDRSVPIKSAKAFQNQFDPEERLNTTEIKSLNATNTLHLLFQLTDAELTTQGGLFDDPNAIDAASIHSYLFFAVDLPQSRYTRTELATIVRAINKPLPMPAIVLFRHGETLSLGIIHRRLNKRDRNRDVLEKVTLIKEISFHDPIRAHIEILNDFGLANLDADYGVSNFVTLHRCWQERLDRYQISEAFYREIADWYFWAHHLVDDGEIKLPRDCDTDEEQSLFLIRLLTRVIFCWFLVEKRLIPSSLFRSHRLAELLHDFQPTSTESKPDRSTSYYHAVLQNLFFGVLNMPPEQRAFRGKKKKGQRLDDNFGITNLWRHQAKFQDSNQWEEIAKTIPFLNGGLFDCLDQKEKKPYEIFDGFSENPKLDCRLPNDLFFGAVRQVDLSKDYGEEKKKKARSKTASVRGLIEILSRYKFTVEENTPLEEEIALDPELLGKVFENLLASFDETTGEVARKAMGAFYTPREIVNYMVDESLKSYLIGQVPRCKGLLEDLFSVKATMRDVKPATREALIAAIGRVKILDPACGSGAFPMGALHRLVDLLQKLDKNNDSFKRDRLNEARTYRTMLVDSTADEVEIAACDRRIKDIEAWFDTRFHALDYARKLHLIENCIYGIDIQPIATQIAKLRFFISLMVDQYQDSKAPNLGVRPLPNLETRIVAADTLIPIDKEESDLFSGELDQLRKDLSVIRHEHFGSRSPQQKRKWRKRDEEKRKEIAKLLEEQHALPREGAQKLASWNPYDQNTHAPFFDSEWMFGLPVGKVKLAKQSQATLRGNFAFVNELPGQQELIADEVHEIDSGFDIVIGNPPYIRLQTLKKKDPEMVKFFRKQYVSAGKGNYDIYVIFIEVGMQLLKPNGHLAYICPHKFFNAQYGEPVRGLIAEGNHLRHVVHFGDEQVFSGATIYTCLLFLQRASVDETVVVQAHNLDAWRERLAGISAPFRTSEISSSVWNFVVGPEASVFKQIEAMPRNLGDVANAFVGLQTSADDVFILTFAEDNGDHLTVFSKAIGESVLLEKQLLHPIVSGTDIDSFCPLPSRQFILFPYNVQHERATLIPEKQLKKQFPRAEAYLQQNRVRLESRERGRFADSEWYRFGRSQNLGIQERNKLCVPRLVNRLHAGLDIDGTRFLDNVDVGGVTWKPELNHRPLQTLMALLNSSVLRWYFPHVSAPFRGGYLSANRQFLELLPIPDTNDQEDAVLSIVVNHLLSLTVEFREEASERFSRDSLMMSYWMQILKGAVP